MNLRRCAGACNTADPIGGGRIVPRVPYYVAIGTTRRPFQLFSWTSSAIGAIELVLTLIGTYGVLSDLVVQRSREIGVRVALGASAAAVVGLVVRQSLRYAAIDVVGVLRAA